MNGIRFDKLNQNFEVHIEIVTVSVCTFFNAFFDEWDKALMDLY